MVKVASADISLLIVHLKNLELRGFKWFCRYQPVFSIHSPFELFTSTGEILVTICFLNVYWKVRPQSSRLSGHIYIFHHCEGLS